MNGTLYFRNQETGEVVGKLNNIVDVEMGSKTKAKSKRYEKPSRNSWGLSFTCDIGRNDSLSLIYGRRVTNNWLKMHGYPMRRKKKK